MTQLLTNYDAEICNGILRIPPNCAKPTKREKRRIIREFYQAMRDLGTPIPVWAKDLQFRASCGRRGNRPPLTIFVELGPTGKGEIEKIKEHVQQVNDLLNVNFEFDWTYLEAQIENQVGLANVADERG